MATVNEKMTALADEIRTLSGTTGTMGLDAMATHVDEANTDVATEAVLIAQIAGALEGKAAGGGSDDTPTNVTLNFSWTATSSIYAPEVFYSFIDENGNYIGNMYVAVSTSGSTTLTVTKNSIIVIICNGTSSKMHGVTSCSISDGIVSVRNRYSSGKYDKSLFLINNNGDLTVTMSSSSAGGSND